jgi:hypothetical protein
MSEENKWEPSVPTEVTIGTECVDITKEFFSRFGLKVTPELDKAMNNIKNSSEMTLELQNHFRSEVLIALMNTDNKNSAVMQDILFEDTRNQLKESLNPILLEREIERQCGEED